MNEARQDVVRQLAGWSVELTRRTAGLAALSARLLPRYAELVRELPRQVLAGGPPTDPLDLLLRVYGATNGPLTAIARELLTDDDVLALLRRSLESWTTVESLVGRASEDLARTLHLATGSDAARVATLVVGLDEKVDRLEDTLEDLDDGAARTRGAEAARLREHLARLEDKLDRLLAAAGDTGGNVDGSADGDGTGNGAGGREGARR